MQKVKEFVAFDRISVQQPVAAAFPVESIHFFSSLFKSVKEITCIYNDSQEKEVTVEAQIIDKNRSVHEMSARNNTFPQDQCDKCCMVQPDVNTPDLCSSLPLLESTRLN